jgi:hypothetical protein
MDMRIQFELLSFSGFCFIINSLMPIINEIDITDPFASKRGNNY